MFNDYIKMTFLKEFMNKIAFIFISCFLVIAISSCSRHYRLKENDISYIPYKGNEVLVFQSDKNRMDTIFLKGTRNFNGCGDPLDISPNKCDGIALVCTRSDPNYDRYLDGKELVTLVAAQSGETHIFFDIVLRSSWFYSLDSYSLSQLESMPNSELTIDNKVYKDVKVFEASEYAKQFQDRDNYAERFYWSLSQGFLGLDRRDEKWRLIKIHTP